MDTPLKDILLKDLPIGQPAKDAFALVNLWTLEDITKHTEKQLLSLHGVGPKAIRIIREHLAHYQVNLK